MYYFWVEDNVGNTASTQIKINNIVILTSLTGVSLYSETSSRIADSEYINDIVKLHSVVVQSGSGTVESSYLSGKNVHYNVSGGIEKSSKRYQTFTLEPRTRSAQSECESYSCSRGGSPNYNGICTDNDYRLPDGTNTYHCKNGAWQFPGEASEQSCDRGFTKRWSCPPAPSGSCTSGTSQTNYCPASCEWNGDYAGTCRSVNYYCSNGYELRGQSCYACSKGTLNRNYLCEYQDLVTYSYWEYTIKINYYKLK